MDLVFVVPRDLSGPSGGTHYNRAVIGALQEIGHRVTVCPVGGAWPWPTAENRRALAEALALHDGTGPIIVDGIIGLAAPEEIRVAVGVGTMVHLLVHSLLTADPGLTPEEHSAAKLSEDGALRSASSIMCVSRWSARDVERDHPGLLAAVAEPGVQRADRAVGSSPPQLLVLAALTPVKNQSAILRALRQLTDIPWTLQIVGSDSVNPAYAQELRAQAEQFPAGRIILRGALTGDALSAVWSTTDLLLVTSRSETFGMVITEALARGIPVIVPGGTGAEEALTGRGSRPFATLPGAIINLSEPDGLALVLTQWFTSSSVRSRWQEAALSRRPTLDPWTVTARRLLAILRP